MIARRIKDTFAGRHDLEDVLRWINGEREVRGLPALAEIPRGEPYSARLCPAAQALSGPDAEVLVGHDTYILQRPLKSGGLWSTEINMPELVTRFIKDFDEGRLPQFKA